MSHAAWRRLQTHVTRHASHVTRHTSHVTRHSSLVEPLGDAVEHSVGGTSVLCVVLELVLDVPVMCDV